MAAHCRPTFALRLIRFFALLFRFIESTWSLVLLDRQFAHRNLIRTSF
jgi:hypothetical protein